MSGVFKAIGTVAGIVALIPSPIQGIAAAVAVTANVLAAVTAKKPVAQGSSTEITIGAKNPSPYIIGESYYGGTRMLQVGYGTADKVQNAYAGIVDIYSVGGPLEALVGGYTDFTLQTFSGTNAIGYYQNNLYLIPQLGLSPQASALSPHWAGCPDWGASYKLSGKAAIFWSARFPAKGDVFRSGLPQLGAVWRGVKAWDPRLDSTWPGGSGSQRWASPASTTAFDAAKLTWTWRRCPGLQGLRYALGTWERDDSISGSKYYLTFGMGLPIDGVIVEDFVELANVCDANGWHADGVLFEPGDRWENLKNILAAGGAEPCIKGGRLGVRVNAPKVALDVITRDDLADGEISLPFSRSYRDRLNTIIPKYRSAAHKWQYVATGSPVQVTAYVTADGEERSEERQFNLVTDPNQAAQLAGYALAEGRETAPIELSCKPRLRKYNAGDKLTLHLPEEEIDMMPVVIVRRTFDPATMKVGFVLREEIEGKHAFALGLTGSSPPAISILSPEEIDGATNGTVIAGAQTLKSLDPSYPLSGDDTNIFIAPFTGVVGAAAILFPSATIAGLDDGTRFAVFWSEAAATYSVEEYPALTSMADKTLIFVGWQATLVGGVPPASPTPPPGNGGNGSTPGQYEV